MRTPRLHQTHLIWELSAMTEACYQVSCQGMVT